MGNQINANHTPEPETPHMARVYDYLVDGTHHYQIDRIAASYLCSLIPSLPRWLKMGRSFLQEAAIQLWKDGITQFIDFGSGFPTSDHIHAVLPQARVIYVDIDPYTVAQGKMIIGDNPNVCYLEGNLCDANVFLQLPEVQTFLDQNQRVAFGLSGVSVFFDVSEFQSLCQELYAWATPGSKLYVTFETSATDQMTPPIQQLIDIFEQTGGSYRFYRMEECLEAVKPWRYSAQGLVPLQRFLGLPEHYITPKDREGIGLEFYGAIVEK